MNTVMTKEKLSVIHIAKKSLHLSNDEYYTLLKEIADVESSKDLDEYGFEAMMFRFHQMGFTSFWNQRNFGYRDGMATPRQVAMIRALWNEFTLGEGDDKSLGKWLMNKFKISSVRFLNKRNAHKAIGALKKMTLQMSADL